MKKLLSLFLIASIVIVSCNSGKPKDLIVNKWKISDINLSNKVMPDSIKQEIMKGTMEFTKQGTMTLTGMGTDESGTYSVSDDGKTLTTVANGKTETSEINELTKSKLVITDKANGNKLTAVPR